MLLLFEWNGVSLAGELQWIGGAPCLHTISANVPIAANAGYYAAIVREKAILRRLVDNPRGLENQPDLPVKLCCPSVNYLVSIAANEASMQVRGMFAGVKGPFSAHARRTPDAPSNGLDAVKRARYPQGLWIWASIHVIHRHTLTLRAHALPKLSVPPPKMSTTTATST